MKEREREKSPLEAKDNGKCYVSKLVLTQLLATQFYDDSALPPIERI